MALCKGRIKGQRRKMQEMRSKSWGITTLQSMARRSCGPIKGCQTDTARQAAETGREVEGRCSDG